MLTKAAIVDWVNKNKPSVSLEQQAKLRTKII
jgi:hypothetical protein